MALRPTVNSMRSVGEYQRQYRWNIDFTMAKLLSGLQNVGLNIQPGAENGDLNLLCETAELPRRTNQGIVLMNRGSQIRLPGFTLPVGIISMSFVETVTHPIHSVIREWDNAIWSRIGPDGDNTASGLSNPDNDLKLKQLDMLQLDSQDNIVRTWRLFGVFLEDFDPGGVLEGAVADVQRVSIMFSYDDYDDFT